jgi:competence protein ComEA
MKHIPKIAVVLVCLLLIAVGATSGSAETAGKLNINTASLEQLTQLKGIGPAYAQKILDYREQHGPFKRIEEITQVQGIGQRTFEANKDLISVD